MILREARRFLRGSPLLNLSAIPVLALGIGASALVLALLLAFSSLVYPGMRDLGYATIAEETGGGGSARISWGRFEELRSSLRQETKLAAYSEVINTTLNSNARSTSLNVAAVSSSFFSVFTLPLTAGRDFSRTEEAESGRHVVILSPFLARNLFNSPANALGRFVVIDGLPYEVIGVAPAKFQGIFGNSIDAWVPGNCVIPLVLRVSSQGLTEPDAWKQVAAFYGLAASDRVSSKQLAAALVNSPPFRVAGEASLHVSQGLTTDPVRDGKMREWLRLGVLLAFGFTVVSSLNYALLLLARSHRFADEVRLKKALGAGSGRLMAELMIGPAAMVVISLFVACLFWAWGLTLVARVSPFYDQLVRGSWHAGILTFAIQLPFACGLTLIIALLPATSFLRDDSVPRMEYASTASRRTGLLLRALVTVQIAFCIGTWILAGMIIVAVVSLMKMPLGYNPSQLTAIRIRPAFGTVTFTVGSTNEKTSSFPAQSAMRSLLDQVRSLPGVRSASFAETAPFDQSAGTLRIQRIDRSSTAPRTVNAIMVSPSYFDTMESKIVLGRGFSASGLTRGTQEIVISEALARELWPGGNPVGHPVRLIYPTFAGIPSFSSEYSVVGIAEDVRLSGFTASPEPTAFLSFEGSSFADITPDLVINGSESVRSLQDLVSRQVPAEMPGLAVIDVYSIGDKARASMWQEKERAYFGLAFALLMALVAYIGLYASLGHYVSSRRRELAVRTCLGASPWVIRRLVLVRAGVCALSALALSLPLWPVLARLSFGEYLGDLSWSTGRALLLSLACVSISVFVSLIPATAASHISPAEVLKEL